MVSFKRNLLENIFSKTRIFQNGIFQKESFRNDFLIPLKSFRRNLSERNPSELFLQNPNLSEWNLSEGIFFRKYVLAKPESFRKNLSENMF
jgi:ABC-type antimicrobial peptide transport system permease subunit